VERVADAEPPANTTTAASASAAETRRATPTIMGEETDALDLSFENENHFQVAWMHG
jgi:hypothetical protein